MHLLNEGKMLYFEKGTALNKPQVQAQSQIEKGKRNLDSGLSLKSQGFCMAFLKETLM